MFNNLIAVVEKGKVCKFSFAMRQGDGTADLSWSPNRFDVLRNSTGSIVYIDQEFQPHPNYNGGILIGAIDTALAGFVSGESYTVVVKEVTEEEIEGGTSTEPALYATFNLSVIAAMTERTRVISEQLTYVRNNQENVIFPRLKRMLTNSGENVVLDLFTYDNANNITGLRVRHFDNAINASAATKDLADEDLPEVGEVATYRVTQEHSLPRSTRSFHRSVADVDAADATATENTADVPVFAPGNEGGWPEE